MKAKSVTLGVVQMCSSTHLSQNLNVASQLIHEAAAKGAELIVLPEYFPLMGKNESDKLAIVEVAGKGTIQAFLSEQAKQHNVWLFAGSMPIQSKEVKRPYGRLHVFNNRGECVSHYDKIHLFDVSVEDNQKQYCESKGTTPGKSPVICDTPWGKVGLAICYDLRFPELFRKYATLGADLVVLPAAFTQVTGKAHWEVLLRARAIENQCFMVASAQAGHHENGRQTWGHSMVVDPWGEIMGQLQQESSVLVVTVDLHQLSSLRKRMPVLEHRVID